MQPCRGPRTAERQIIDQVDVFCFFFGAMLDVDGTEIVLGRTEMGLGKCEFFILLHVWLQLVHVIAESMFDFDWVFMIAVSW